MALTEKDFVEVARAMNEATGLTACHSGDAENMVAALRRSGLDVIALNEMPDMPFNPEDEPPYFRNG